ncbi:hypothetical protein [Cytobacillus gottheilii]|uniref:hypothetical protein n=1 Tax=Cytobacillus gottheilii TaxID=859144 RepID=UPI0009BA8072|nr:hypothetical protein [Cytobacillus gottheilii]
MGYILPINHTQYQQYAERDLKVKPDPFRFQRVERVHNHLETFNDNENLGRQEVVLTPKSEKSINPVPHEKVERLYSEITGKGRLFNEVV